MYNSLDASLDKNSMIISKHYTAIANTIEEHSGAQEVNQIAPPITDPVLNPSFSEAVNIFRDRTTPMPFRLIPISPASWLLSSEGEELPSFSIDFGRVQSITLGRSFLKKVLPKEIQNRTVPVPGQKFIDEVAISRRSSMYLIDRFPPQIEPINAIGRSQLVFRILDDKRIEVKCEGSNPSFINGYVVSFGDHQWLIWFRESIEKGETAILEPGDEIALIDLDNYGPIFSFKLEERKNNNNNEEDSMALREKRKQRVSFQFDDKDYDKQLQLALELSKKEYEKQTTSNKRKESPAAVARNKSKDTKGTSSRKKAKREEDIAPKKINNKPSKQEEDEEEGNEMQDDIPFAPPPTAEDDEQDDDNNNSSNAGTDKSGTFLDWQHLCDLIQAENSYSGKTKIIKEFLKKWKGDVYLLCRLLLARDDRRVFNLREKAFATILTKALNHPKVTKQAIMTDFEQGDMSATAKKFLEISGRAKPKSTLTLKVWTSLASFWEFLSIMVIRKWTISCPPCTKWPRNRNSCNWSLR